MSSMLFYRCARGSQVFSSSGNSFHFTKYWSSCGRTLLSRILNTTHSCFSSLTSSRGPASALAVCEPGGKDTIIETWKTR